jgi:hypothetical protein
MRLIRTHIYTLTRMRICCRAWEQAIHDLRAAHEQRTDLLAIDGLRCGRPAAAGKASETLGHCRSSPPLLAREQVLKIAVDAEPAESGHFRSFSYQG